METTNPTQTQVNLSDVSPRVHELMQRIDRLPPGTYQVIIIKNEVRAMEWNGEIAQVIERFSVSKGGTYRPE